MITRILKNRHFLLTLAVMAAATAAVMAIRFQAAPVPLERDEGEYALMGQLILDGVPPYAEAANMKLPGTYYAYSAIFTLFGQTPKGVHLGLMLVNFLSTVILYLIARPLLGNAGAALTGAGFAVMSMKHSVLGLFAHATQFVVLFALAGAWLILKSPDSRKELLILFLAGICLGLSFLMKQSGVFFALFGFCWVVGNELRQRPVAGKRLALKAGCLAAGIVLPYAALLGLMARQGALDRFWFWTVEYARTYASRIDFMTGMEVFKYASRLIIGDNLLLCSMALAGLLFLGFTRSGRKGAAAPFLVFFYLFSFLAVCPGFYFRQHYFVQILPAVALLAGAGLSGVEKLTAGYSKGSVAEAVSLALLIGATAVFLSAVFPVGHALAKLTPGAFSRSVYGLDPFPESVRIADYLAQNTRPDERIAILGSEPEIYFYAHRRPATEHIYMYGLMEEQPFASQMQDQVIAEVEKSAPRYIVFIAASSSWLVRDNSEMKIWSWMRDYIGMHYRPVMETDIYPEKTVWLSDKDRESFFRSGKWIAFTPFTSKVLVFKRNMRDAGNPVPGHHPAQAEKS